MTLSLLSTCSWCVVRAYTWLSLCLSLLSTCSWCVVSAYTWLTLCLSLLSTCSWCVVSSYTDCLHHSLSSPPVAGVWWPHTLDWLYLSLLYWPYLWRHDSLSSPPVAGVWWEHTLTVFITLSPPVAGGWGRSGAIWLPSHHPGGCCRLVVVEETPPPLLCKALWVPRKVIYKCNKLLFYVTFIPLSPINTVTRA